MATNIRGDITYLIGANNTGFTKAIGETRRELNSLFKDAGKLEKANILGGIFAKGAAGAVGAIASIGAATAALADNFRETSILADQTDLTVQAFRSLDLAAQQYGLTGEQVADITKDVKDRAQEFARDGTGAFEDLRNELGLTKEEGRELASQMVEMSGDKAIGLMIKRMEDLGLSGNQMTQVLESMGNDLIRLYPLFRDNSSELDRLNAAARAVQLPDTDEQAKAFKDLSESVDLLGVSITSWLEGSGAPLVDFFTDAAKASTYFFSSINEGTEDNLASDIVDINEELRDLEKELGNNESAWGRFKNVATFTSTDNEVLTKKIEELKKERERLTKQLNEIRGLTFPEPTASGGTGTGNTEEPDKTPVSTADKEEAQKSLDALTKSVQTEQQKLDQRKKQFKDYYNKQFINETQYTEAKKALAIQQETIDKNTAETAKREADREFQIRQQKIDAIVNFSNDLSNVNPNDVLTSQLEALDDVYSDSLKKDKNYYDARKQIRQDFLESIGANEEPDFGGGAIGSLFSETETEKIDARNAKLEEAYANDELSFQEYQTAKDNIEQQYNANRIAQTDKALSNLATLQSSHSKKAQAVGKAAAITQTTIATYTSATEAYKAMAGIPIVGPVLGAAAAAAAAAAGLANVQKIRGAKAVGGQISANTAEPYLVGEKGAELFVPNQAGNIIPNNQLGGGGTTNVNISAIDAAGVEQLLLENTDLILGLVREA